MCKVFAVGTGRCGMNRWAEKIGGYAESKMPLRELAVRYYQDPSTDISFAYETYKKRLADPSPGIADCCQHMWINVIQELDPTVKFVWLLRNKKNCIESFLKRSNSAESQRIHPKGWEFKAETMPELYNWYYDEVNSRIHKDLIGKNFEIVLTETL